MQVPAIVPPVEHWGAARYKSRPCKHFSAGRCPWGDNCLFAHDAGELRTGFARSCAPVRAADPAEAVGAWEAAIRGATGDRRRPWPVLLRLRGALARHHVGRRARQPPVYLPPAAEDDAGADAPEAAVEHVSVFSPLADDDDEDSETGEVFVGSPAVEGFLGARARAEARSLSSFDPLASARRRFPDARRRTSLRSTPVEATPRRPAPGKQVRYLLLDLACAVTEACRARAAAEKRDKRWVKMAGWLQAAFEQIVRTLDEVGEWYVLGHDAEAAARLGHDAAMLDTVLDTLDVVRDDTGRARDDALRVWGPASDVGPRSSTRAEQRRRCQRRLDSINGRLNPINKSRDSARAGAMARLGMERWESNPRPKYDFSAKRAALLRERAEVSQAIQTIEGLGGLE